MPTTTHAQLAHHAANYSRSVNHRLTANDDDHAYGVWYADNFLGMPFGHHPGHHRTYPEYLAAKG